MTVSRLAPLAPDLLASFEGQRQRAAVMAGLFGEPEVPPAFGRFTLLRKLGAGGMGVVYAAYDPQLDRTIALKLLRGETGVEERRLVREAQLLAQLSHPNVVAVFDVGEIDGQAYIAMEYVPGETLRAWSRERPRSWRETLAMLVQAGRGLAAAHAAGTIHRDFKPENIMIAADGRARVLDFGLASPTRGGAQEVVAGTLGYIAPEQRQGRCDATSDQYSYCVTLFEALYGVRPDVVGERRRALPRWLDRAVRRGLRPEPGERWASLDLLLDELEDGPRRRRRRLQGAVVTLAIVVTLVAARSLREADLAACSGISGVAAEMWNEPRRSRLEGALLATGSPAAGRVAEVVDRRLRDYASRWTTTYQGACSARRREELSEESYDRITGCLQRGRTEAVALADALESGGDELILRAVQSADDLGRPDACLDASADEAFAAARTRPEVAAVLRKIAAAKAESRLYRHESARDRATAALAAAKRLELPIVVLEATLRLGAIEHHAERFTEAEELLSAAYFGALAIDSAEIASVAALNLLPLIGYKKRDLSRTAYWEQTLLAFVDRVDDDDFRARADQNIGMVRAVQERFSEARSAYDRAIAWHERSPDSTPEDRARLLDLRAYVRHMEGDSDGAVADLSRAVELREGYFGPAHPSLAASLNNLGVLFVVRREYEEARDVLTRALALQPSESSEPLANLADVHDALGDHASALALSRRSLALAERAGAGHAATDARLRIGRALTGLAQVDEGVSWLRRAVAESLDRFGGDHRAVAEARFELARALTLRGGPEDAGEALALLRQATPAFPPDDPTSQKFSGEIARLVERLGHAPRSRAQREPARRKPPVR